MQWGSTWRHRRVAVAAVTVGLLAATACTRPPSGSSGGAAALFEPTGDAAALETMAADVAGAPVAVDAAAIDRDPPDLRVRTPQGLRPVKRARTERRGPGNLTWIGRS